MLTGLTGVATCIDDINFAAASQYELLQRLFSVFSRIEQYKYAGTTKRKKHNVPFLAWFATTVLFYLI